MKKIVIGIAVVVAILGIAITIGIVWDKVAANKEAEQRKADAGFYAEQKAKTDEANQKQAEYNRSVGRPDNAN